MRDPDEVRGYMKVELQYGVQIPGEDFVRLQPDHEAALRRAGRTEGAVVLVHNPRTGQWENA